MNLVKYLILGFSKKEKWQKISATTLWKKFMKQQKKQAPQAAK